MKVFISYRREDSAGHTGRLYDSLRGRIGKDNLFLDLSGIDSGQNFVDVIQTAIHSCDLLLAIVGGEWLTCTVNGRRRLDDPADLVRTEVATALERHVPVIPVLVGGAAPPAAAALPQPLKPLATLDAHELSDERWEYDVERLIAAMHKIAAPSRDRRRRAWLLAAALLAVAIAALAVIGSYAWRRIAESATGGRTSVASAPSIAGDWSADVTYEWGARHAERFSFSIDGNEVSGTASFLGVPRGIVSGSIQGDRIRFDTHTQEVSGEQSHETVHQYRGRIVGDTIAFSMQTSGGTSQVPVQFTATRERRR
jgi:hypothetical protein